MWSTARTGFGLLTTALLGLVAVGAAAQDSSVTPAPSTGFYIGGGVGANFQEENRFRGGGGDSNTTYNPGFVGLLNFGYGLGNGLRLELEPAWRQNDADRMSGVSGHGGTDIGSLMVNGLYDFDTPMLHGWQPHLGAGVGAARVHNHTASANTPVVDGNDTVPAFQAIAGVDYPVTPALKLGIDYRYFLAHDTSFHNAATGASVRGGDFNDHAILVTFRYQFGAAPAPHPEPAAAVASPPAPPATPPAATTQQYNVYFDWDKSLLTADARKIIDRVASQVKSDGSRVAITGKADLSGTDAYNMALSHRRADAVRQALQADGVPAERIAEHWVGMREPPVPTAAGVREPRNRVVEIVLP